MIAVETRKCSKCGAVHPLTEEFFDAINPLILVETSIFVLSVRNAQEKQAKVRILHTNLQVNQAPKSCELRAIVAKKNDPN